MHIWLSDWSFNSRTPGGVRQPSIVDTPRGAVFQFTHPGRGATMQDMCLSTTEIRFNSRTPGGVRLLRPSELELIVEFQFTHPGRGATMTRGSLS